MSDARADSVTTGRGAAASFQLPLGIGLRDVASFDNFVAAGNREAVEALQQAVAGAQPAMFYLWGEPGGGKSHLLQAVCRAFTARHEAAAYVPLAQLPDLAPAALDGLESLAGVCIDDIDSISGRGAWEEAIFHLFNRMRDAGRMLVIAACGAPAQSPVRLADLRSRLGAMTVFRVHALDDDGKRRALQRRARQRGLDLPDDVAAFLLRHYRRDTASLFALLERLDETSMVAQRRLTIPFVKSIIAR